MVTSVPKVNFDLYIRKVLAQVHPDAGITKDAVSQLNSLLNMLGESIASTAAFLCSTSMVPKQKKKQDRKTCTVYPRTIQASVKLTLPGHLARHALSEGVKAITHYTANTPDSGKKNKPRRKEALANLQFPVARAEKLIRSQHCGRMSEGAPVYLAAVIEYIAAEILELSGHYSRDNRKARISVRAISSAIDNDSELLKMIRKLGWKTLGGGVVPNLHAQLLPKK